MAHCRSCGYLSVLRRRNLVTVKFDILIIRKTNLVAAKYDSLHKNFRGLDENEINFLKLNLFTLFMNGKIKILEI